jgi:hypothetical protein
LFGSAKSQSGQWRRFRDFREVGFGSKPESLVSGLMSARTGCGHAAAFGYVREVPDIVAKVPNGPALIFLL